MAWTDGTRRLRVMVVADFSPSADAALRWAAGLRAIGPCDVVVAYSSWPPAERRRLGTGVRSTVFENDPEIDAVLRRDLERKVGVLAGDGETRIRVETALGQVPDHLVGMAREDGADLVVAGSRRRHGASRLWQQSVSRGVLRAAPMSVACVPATHPHGREAAPIPEIHTVVAATDLSALGDRAVPVAYAMLPQGGTVHLVHVVELAGVQDLYYTDEQRAAQEPGLAELLQALVPAEAAKRGVQTQVHVIEAKTAGAAIVMAAERLAADAICVGSHGRSGLAATVAGSVAQEVIARSRRPVVVVGARD